MTLRDQKSAYDGMRKEVVGFTTSRVAPQVDLHPVPAVSKLLGQVFLLPSDITNRPHNKERRQQLCQKRKSLIKFT